MSVPTVFSKTLLPCQDKPAWVLLPKEKVSQALEEIEGQVVENSSVSEFSGENRRERDARQDGETGQGGILVGPEEDEDECPHLIALSSLSKEFRPFRYRFLLIVFSL